MAQVLFEAEETATLRADEDRPGMGSQLATANAPVAASGYFKVPRVIEK
jgi:aspartyl-tRNA(Asn)/glutamyl-tRNA(Gln) amidotransferase subunit C